MPAPLPQSTVVRIRKLLALGRPKAAIARLAGVSRKSVQRIARRGAEADPDHASPNLPYLLKDVRPPLGVDLKPEHRRRYLEVRGRRRRRDGAAGSNRAVSRQGAKPPREDG